MYKPRIAFLVSTVFISLMSFAQSKPAYKYRIDLKNTANDKVKVELVPPAIQKDEIVFYLPKTVPGTYSVDDYGRYLENFKAFDRQGKPLKTEKADVNGWKIFKAKTLGKVTYTINDTFDDTLPGKKVFEPTGSNIETDKNYLINNHCFLGYFEGMKEYPYELTVLHKPNMYGSSPLTDTDKSAESDRFVAETYNRIVDNPIMYAEPDTATLHVGASEVLISVYSPNKKVTAAYLAENLDKLLQAQGKYLGGKLPVQKYAFLIYLTDGAGVSGGMGALEHSYSSVYFLPETDPGQLTQFFVDVAAHEFFHILTPLSIHSEEIQYFDFNNPKMSEHLWLYEGSTEYHAHLVQVRYGLITEEAFLKKMQEKITNSRDRYNDTLPFTVMSANVLDKGYKDQYGNVYEKGALIAMVMDLRLRNLSGGKYGIIDLVNDLSQKYGKDKPFKDDELFNEIEKLTYPQIRSFLDSFVAGNHPLPLVETFAMAGVDYFPVQESKDSVFTLGGVGLMPTESDGKLTVTNMARINEFGTKIGYQKGDIIQTLNGKPITAQNFSASVGELYKTSKVGDPIEIIVERKEDGATAKNVSLVSQMQKIPIRKFNVLVFKPDATEQQKQLREYWLKAAQ